ncbi:MAG: acyl--CoA ligase, partial [Candidatus Latescibacteria bacterium]|nr:acyl--CoA ligase [Candidatus Latescibacterota bacterium]
EVELLVVDRKGYERFDTIRERLDKTPQIALTEGEAEGAILWEELAGSSAAVPEVEVLPEDEAKILYTSGSTGLPKGVIQTHANIVANVEEVWDVISKREPLRMFKS